MKVDLQNKIKYLVDNIMEHYEVGSDLTKMEQVIRQALLHMYNDGVRNSNSRSVTSFYGIPNKHTTPLFTLIKGGKLNA